MPLRTPKQLAEEEHLTVYQVRRLLREQRLGHVMIGSRPMIPDGAYDDFIASNTVQPCRDETPGLASVSSKSEASTTSSGLKAVAAGSARRAQQIASKLKSRSPNSSMNGNGEPGLVIPIRSS